VVLPPEELRDDELSGPRRELVAGVVTSPDVAILERDLVVGEKLPHAAAFLSGRRARFRVERVEDDV
jgi:hypothetical protein